MSYDLMEALKSSLERAVYVNDHCHDLVACPTCIAPKGKRCRTMPRGFRPLDIDHPRAPEIRISHEMRVRLAHESSS